MLIYWLQIKKELESCKKSRTQQDWGFELGTFSIESDRLTDWANAMININCSVIVVKRDLSDYLSLFEQLLSRFDTRRFLCTWLFLKLQWLIMFLMLKYWILTC